MIVDVAAGVIEGKIVTDSRCIVPARASRRMTGSRPVSIAGQTTRGVAASITISRTFDGTPQSTLRELFRPLRHYPLEAVIHTVHTSVDAPPEPSDEELMLDVRGGGDGGSVLFARYRQPVWRFFRRRVADAGRAEELAQDVFTAMLEAAPRYAPTASFRSYLFGIAYNVLMASQRRASSPIQAPDVDFPAEAGPGPEDAMWVRQALARLDPQDREILMLREYEQLGYQEIADLQCIPLNTVRSRLFRARMALKQALRPELVRPEQERR